MERAPRETHYGYTNMRPLLLHIPPEWPLIGDLRFHAYPTMLSLAFLVCTLLAARDGDRLKRPVFVPPQAAVFALIGALFGAKLWWVLQYRGIGDILLAFNILQAGLVYYGGLIGGALGALGYLYFTKTLDRRIVDVAFPYLALGEAITRVGCFLNGCCWGAPSTMPWAVTFPRHSHAYDQQAADGLISRAAELPLAVHPTQLYMTVGLVVTCLALRWLLFHKPFTYSGMCGYFFCYGILRFTVECLRADSPIPYGGFTLSGVVSLGLMVFGAGAYFILEQNADRWGLREDQDAAESSSESSAEPKPAGA